MAAETLADYDYELPESSIAQAPPETRDGGRLMVLPRDAGGDIEHHDIIDLPSLLRSPCLLLVNDSKVLPARLAARRQSGGKVEIMLLERRSEGRWWAMVRASKGPKVGEELGLLTSEGDDPGVGATARVLSVPRGGRCEVALDDVWVHRLGAMPLPPYIRRPADADDARRYQTVYAREEGSVAAPTAGLHLTPRIFEALAAEGHEVAKVTLHVGPGTFVPVRCDDPAQHTMEQERYEVSEETAAAIAEAKAEGRRILAVGTTVVRTLEASRGIAGQGRTELFIRPGHRFSVVESLLTNFHLPRSTLLMLVSALGGRERILEAYRTAIAEGYRFYSYGDAMLVL